MRVLDANAKPTFPSALTGEVKKDVPESLKLVPMQFGITLCAGSFTLELKARDQIAKTSTTVKVPLQVVVRPRSSGSLSVNYYAATMAGVDLTRAFRRTMID